MIFTNQAPPSQTVGSYTQSLLTRLICARSRTTLIICHPSRVMENPFAMRVFCSALLCSWQRRQKSKEVRDWPERLSFIFNSLFSSSFLFEISKLLFSQFLSLVLAKLGTRHLEPWNTRKIVHIWQPLTQLSFDPFRTREYRENCFYLLDWKEMKILTWNINGIRAARRDKSLKEVLDSLEADVICLQETKVTRE